MDVLPIGSIVRLKNGSVKLMILNRAPLYNKNGVIGYFDYSACIYPTGKTEEGAYFFNKNDIEKIYFEGYKDEQEELFREKYEEQMQNVKYTKFSTNE